MNDLFQGFGFIRENVDDLLIITKGDLEDHIQKLELTPNKNLRSGIKCDIKQYLFG